MGKGRVKGVPNKTTATTRQMLVALIDKNLPNAQKWLDAAAKRSPAMALKIFTELCSYAVPRLAAVAVEQHAPGEGMSLADLWARTAALADRPQPEQQATKQSETQLLRHDPVAEQPRPAPRLTVEPVPDKAPVYTTPAPPQADRPRPVPPTVPEPGPLEGQLIVAAEAQLRSAVDQRAAALERHNMRQVSLAFARQHGSDCINGVVRRGVAGNALDVLFADCYANGWRPGQPIPYPPEMQ